MNKTYRRLSLGLVAVFALLLTPQTSRAQFTASYQTNIIDGVVSNWSGVYIAGSNIVFDQLQVVSGGVFTGAFENLVGYGTSASNNSALVSSTGSVWQSGNLTAVGYKSSHNALVISNGGRVISYGAWVGFCGSSNSVLVTGSGSVWSNSANLDFGVCIYSGYESHGNSIVVSNGGQFINWSLLTGTDVIGGYFSTNNSVLVTGAGSLWNDSGTLCVGSQGGGNSLVVNGGGKVLSSSAVIGYAQLGVTADSNTVLVSGTGSVWSNQGSFFVGRWIGTTSQVAFVSHGNSLVIGDGGAVVVGSNMVVASGNSVVLANGDLTVGTGLVISNGAILKGSGTIYANLTLAGTLAPGNSPGALTNFGSLTLQSSAMVQFELGGTTQGSGYDFILVTNGMATLDGLLQVSFINGFQTNVLNSDTFTLLTADTLTGSFTNVLSGERLMTVGGGGSFLVDYSGDSLVLRDYQVIPEPGTWALCALGLAGLLVGRQQSRRLSG